MIRADDDHRLAEACRDPGETRPFAVDATRAPDPALARVLAAAVHASRASIVITDAELDRPGPRIVYANPAFEAMTGHPAATLTGRDPRLLQGRATARAVLDRLRADLARDGRFEGETVNYRADGTPFVMSWRIASVPDERGVTTHYVAIQDDVTDDRVRSLDTAVLVSDLQRLGLPDVPPRVGAFEVAGGYRPGRAGLPVGGDWFDAIETDGGRTALVVGDVAGNGAESVVAMGMLRWTIGALLTAGMPLAQVAAVAHRTARRAQVHASVAIASLDPGGAGQVLTAGHPPVLVADAGRSPWPVRTSNPMLGVGRPADWEVAEVGLAPGATAVLVTDGVVDGGRIDVDDVPQEIASRMGHDPSPVAIRDALLASTPDGDDAAVIAARLVARH